MIGGEGATRPSRARGVEREYYGDNMDSCIFCKIIKGEVSDFIIRETDDIIVILSLEGHPLIIPKRHIENIYGLEPDIASQIMVEAVTMAKAVNETSGCTGLNLIQSNGRDAGQEVFHFHLHVRPRWHDDGIEATWNTAELDRDKRQVLSDKLLEYFETKI